MEIKGLCSCTQYRSYFNIKVLFIIITLIKIIKKKLANQLIWKIAC